MRTRAGSRSLPSLLEAFTEGRLARSYSSRSENARSRMLSRFFAHLGERGVRDPRAVNEADVVSFLDQLKSVPSRRGGPLSLSMLHEYLSVIRTFFAFLVKRGVILWNPAQGVSLPRQATLPRDVLSEAQCRRLMNASSPWTPIGQRDRAILETLYGTGIRGGECARLDLVDVSLSEGRLLIRDGKGKQDRVVPLVGRAAVAIELYLRQARLELAKSAQEGALFLSRIGGRRLSSGGICQMVERHAEVLKLPARPHGLRHACATHLLQGGADIRHVQQLLGHRDIQNTTRYTRVMLKDLQQVLDRRHPRSRAVR